MRRFVAPTVIALATLLVTGPALAFQCPTLVRKIDA